MIVFDGYQDGLLYDTILEYAGTYETIIIPVFREIDLDLKLKDSGMWDKRSTIRLDISRNSKAIIISNYQDEMTDREAIQYILKYFGKKLYEV